MRVVGIYPTAPGPLYMRTSHPIKPEDAYSNPGNHFASIQNIKARTQAIARYASLGVLSPVRFCDNELDKRDCSGSKAG